MLNYKHINTNPNTIVYTVYYKLIVSYVQTIQIVQEKTPKCLHKIKTTIISAKSQATTVFSCEFGEKLKNVGLAFNDSYLYVEHTLGDKS